MRVCMKQEILSNALAREIGGVGWAGGSVAGGQL